MVSVLVFQLASCFCFDAMIVVTLVGTPADGASPHLVKPFSITCKDPPATSSGHDAKNM